MLAKIKKNISIINYDKKHVFHYKFIYKAKPSYKLNIKLLVLSADSIGKAYINFININQIPIYNYIKFITCKNFLEDTCLYLLDRNFLESKNILTIYNFLVNQINTKLFIIAKGWSYKLNFLGLGYKVFIYKNFLYLKLGFCRIIKLIVPEGIKIFSRKRNCLILLSEHHDILSSFIFKLKSLRKFNFYKGKGVFEYSTFEGIKLKVGKQQQFY